MRLSIVPTGTANLASMTAALRRLGVSPFVARDAGDVETADGLVLPGVGAFGAAMKAVSGSGFSEAIATRISAGRPTLAVCVGMQLFATGSEESPGATGFGLFPVEVRRFPGSVRVPQLGWNRVEASAESRFVTDGWAYFANSFRITDVPAGWVGAAADHGGGFVAAIERRDILACQFHPELSGDWGHAVLERWLGSVADAG